MQRIPYSPSKLRGPSGSTPADRTLLFLPGRQEEWKMPSRFSTKCKVCSQSFLQCSCKICSHLEEEKAVEKSIPSRCPWASPLLMAEQRPATARRWQCCGVRTVIWRAREWGHKYRVILHVPGVSGGTWRQDHRHLPVSAQVFVVAWGSEMTASCSWFSGIISLSYYQLQIFYCLHCWMLLKNLFARGDKKETRSFFFFAYHNTKKLRWSQRRQEREDTCHWLSSNQTAWRHKYRPEETKPGSRSLVMDYVWQYQPAAWIATIYSCWL